MPESTKTVRYNLYYIYASDKKNNSMPPGRAEIIRRTILQPSG